MNAYIFTRRFLDPGIVSTSELVPDVFELPKWRAYLCAFTISRVGGLTCHVYELVGADKWRRVKTFWNDWR